MITINFDWLITFLNTTIIGKMISLFGYMISIVVAYFILVWGSSYLLSKLVPRNVICHDNVPMYVYVMSTAIVILTIIFIITLICVIVSYSNHYGPLITWG